MDSAKELIAYIDSGRRFVVVNNMYEEVFKIPRKNIEGVHLKDFHGDIRYREVIDGHLTSCFKGGEIVKFQQWVHVQHCDRMCLDISFAPHFENKEVVGVVVTASIVTELEIAKQQLIDRTHQLQALALDLEDKIKIETDKRIQHEQLFFLSKRSSQIWGADDQCYSSSVETAAQFSGGAVYPIYHQQC